VDENEFNGEWLLELLKPDHDFFEIVLRGKTLKGRMLHDMREMEKIKKKARSLAAMTSKTAPAKWREYLPITPAEADVIAAITEILIDPKISDFTALQLCREAGPATFALHIQIMEQLGSTMVERESEELDGAKNE
jgi:hypothetical protein